MTAHTRHARQGHGTWAEHTDTKLDDMKQVWGWAVRMRAGPDGVPTVMAPGTTLCGKVANALRNIVMRQPYTNPGLFGKFLAGHTKADPRTSWPGFETPVTTLFTAHRCSGITPGQTCAPAWPSVIPRQRSTQQRHTTGRVSTHHTMRRPPGPRPCEERHVGSTTQRRHPDGVVGTRHEVGCARQVHARFRSGKLPPEQRAVAGAQRPEAPQQHARRPGHAVCVPAAHSPARRAHPALRGWGRTLACGRGGAGLRACSAASAC